MLIVRAIFHLAHPLHSMSSRYKLYREDPRTHNDARRESIFHAQVRLRAVPDKVEGSKQLGERDHQRVHGKLVPRTAPPPHPKGMVRSLLSSWHEPLWIENLRVFEDSFIMAHRPGIRHDDAVLGNVVAPDDMVLLDAMRYQQGSGRSPAEGLERRFSMRTCCILQFEALREREKYIPPRCRP